MLEHLDDPCFVEVELAGCTRVVVVERTRGDSIHAVTVDDLVRLLEHVDPSHIEGLDLFILRQPTRKQETIESVWGRLAYYLEIGRHVGAALVLEAVTSTTRITFQRKLSRDRAAELSRLRDEGVEVRTHRRGFEALADVSTERETQLYRTVLHEIGHYVDYIEQVGDDLSLDEWSAAWDRNWLRPTSEREVFAHAYAHRHASELRDRGLIPFDRLDAVERLIELGLRPSDFFIEPPG